MRYGLFRSCPWLLGHACARRHWHGWLAVVATLRFGETLTDRPPRFPATVFCGASVSMRGLLPMPRRTGTPRRRLAIDHRRAMSLALAAARQAGRWNSRYCVLLSAILRGQEAASVLPARKNSPSRQEADQIGALSYSIDFGQPHFFKSSVRHRLEAGQMQGIAISDLQVMRQLTACKTDQRWRFSCRISRRIGLDDEDALGNRVPSDRLGRAEAIHPTRHSRANNLMAPPGPRSAVSGRFASGPARPE